MLVNGDVELVQVFVAGRVKEEANETDFCFEGKQLQSVIKD